MGGCCDQRPPTSKRVVWFCPISISRSSLQLPSLCGLLVVLPPDVNFCSLGEIRITKGTRNCESFVRTFDSLLPKSQPDGDYPPFSSFGGISSSNGKHFHFVNRKSFLRRSSEVVAVIRKSVSYCAAIVSVAVSKEIKIKSGAVSVTRFSGLRHNDSLFIEQWLTPQRPRTPAFETDGLLIA